ncbi:sigma-70 family RNA polymerase sigma factor [candidate division KSB1 bacterium]|nr:sigma-70 family RNA polymerase sigma factor [candidate division KSB1 bacterium]
MSHSFHAFTDEELVQLFLDGEDEYFQPLFERYQHRLYKLAYMMLCDESEAEDAVQDVMLTVFQKLASYKSNASFFTWLYQITLNRCRDRIRRNKWRALLFKRSNGAEDELPEVSASIPQNPTWEALHQSEINRLIEKYMQQLHPDHRQIIILRDIEGFSYEEIAGIMNLTLGAVKSKLFRARSQLRQKLVPYHKELLYD